MKLPEQGSFLGILIGTIDYFHGRLHYEEIDLRDGSMNLAGATVLRRVMGFCAGSRNHSAKVLRLPGNFPIIIEIADTSEKIDQFMTFPDEVVNEGLIMREKVNIVIYRLTGKGPVDPSAKS